VGKIILRAINSHAEHLEEIAAGEEKSDQDRERDQQLAHDDEAIARGIDVPQRREEQRHVAQRIHDEEQQDGGREQTHGLSSRAELYPTLGAAVHPCPGCRPP
jgi:hypothetical protein